MRIIAGKFRGRTLLAPPGDDTRPITDRIKESIFNILGARFATLGDLPDVDVLDLFAGSGSFGIEALSRGARTCQFVERNRVALAALRANVENLDLSAGAARVSAENAWRFRPVVPAGSGFGLAFVDPPYRDVENGPRIAELLGRVGDALAADGLIVFRHALESAFDAASIAKLAVADDRTMGSMRVWFLARR